MYENAKNDILLLGFDMKGIGTSLENAFNSGQIDQKYQQYVNFLIVVNDMIPPNFMADLEALNDSLPQ